MAFKMTEQVFKTNILLKQCKLLAQDLKRADYAVSFDVVIVQFPKNVVLWHFVKQ